jgi:hypothetical protein
VKKGDIMVSAWLALSAAVITQVDFGALNLPGAKAKAESKPKPSTKCEDKGDAFTPAGAEKVAKCIARRKHGYRGAELVALDKLWTWESGWAWNADNPTSSAYGIPQGLVDLHHLPEKYLSDPVYQIRWGLRYVDVKFDLPSRAWAFHQSKCSSSLGCFY